MFKFNKFMATALLAVAPFVSAKVAADEKVLFLLSAHHRGYSLPESMDVYEVLAENGIEVEFASPQGAAGLPWGADRLPAEHSLQYINLLAAGNINNPQALSDVSVEDYDAVYVPGGYGPVFDLIEHPEVQRVLSGMYEAGRIVSAICHGPAALAGVKLSSGELLVEGRAVTGKPLKGEGKWAKANMPVMLETRLRDEGGKFSAADVGDSYVVHDGLLLTGQNANSAKQLGNKLVEILKGLAG